MLLAFWSTPFSLNTSNAVFGDEEETENTVSPIERYMDRLEDTINGIPYIGIDASTYERFIAGSICLEIANPQRLFLAELDNYTVINAIEFARQVNEGVVNYEKLLQIEDPDCVYYLTTSLPANAQPTHFLPGQIEKLNFLSAPLSPDMSDIEKQTLQAADVVRQLYTELLLGYAQSSSAFMDITKNPEQQVETAKDPHTDMLRFLGYVGYFYYADLRMRLDPDYNIINQKVSWQFALAELGAHAQQFSYSDILNYSAAYELWKCHPQELKNAPEDYNSAEFIHLYHNILSTQLPVLRVYNHMFEYKVGRNDLCPCGSGKKVKYCHGL